MSKETNVMSKETNVMSKETNVMSKETNVMSYEMYMGDVERRTHSHVRTRLSMSPMYMCAHVSLCLPCTCAHTSVYVSHVHFV